MSFEPRKQRAIYVTLRDRLKGKIPDLTNFTDTSFNWVWTQGFAAEFREQELDKTATYLSGLVDYAGGPLDEGDLQTLGISDLATPEEINDRLDDESLEELTKIVSTTRDPGSEATGTVTFTTRTGQTDIPQFTSVGVQPDGQGNFIEYETTEYRETIDGETEVDAPIKATEVGAEYNVGSGQITYLPSPPAGVFEVVNNTATEGGEDIETNDELRERAKNAIFRLSGGGTVSGVEGYIEENVDGVDEVNIIEFFTGDTWHGSYPHAHVVVSGGDPPDIRNAIDESRPVAVQHIYIDVNNYNIRFDVTMNGVDIEKQQVKDALGRYVNDIGIAGELVDVKVIQSIMNADDDIDDLANLDTYIENESIFFNPGTDIYELTYGVEMENDGITEVTGDRNTSEYIFTEDTDWQEVDNDGDTSDDSIDWSIGDTSTTVTISYTAGQTEYNIDANMLHDGITSVQNTTQGTTLTEDTETTAGDFEEADTTGDNLHDGIRFLTTQNDGDSIDITYDAGNEPDVTIGNTNTLTFDPTVDKYIVDDGLITDGIKKVTGTLNGAANTFVEDTDYEEIDVRADGVINGINWGLGGDNPDDGTDFTVTYESGTQFDVTYRVKPNTDLSFDEDSQPVIGTINTTVVE